MEMLTLEQAKHNFEVGTIGNFLVKFESNASTTARLKALASRFNLIGSKEKYMPVTSVSYTIMGMDFKSIQLGGMSIDIPNQIKFPDSVSFEVLEDNKETITKAFLEWYKISPIYTTGRTSRNPLVQTLTLSVYHFDKPSSGKSIEVVRKEQLLVTIPDSIGRDNNQGTAIKKGNYTLKVLGIIE